MVKARKYIVKRHFEGLPSREDYEIVEHELPPLQDSEMLIKAEWISVDPYMRLYNTEYPVPYDQFGFQIGEVIDTKDPQFPIGTKIVSHKGWCDYSIVNINDKKSIFDVSYKLPDLQGMSSSLGIGAVGPVGATAYLGFLSICKPKYGETVVVTTAAGAVGSLVGQIAKIKGCRVIGFTGSDEKVKYLESLGFDKAFNYKTVDIDKVLKEAAPNGVDCYFDNVGGEMASIIIHQMNTFGRISVCGSISAYNEDLSLLPRVPMLQVDIVKKQLKMEGFLVLQWLDQWPEAYEQLTKWIKSEELKPKEHITEGFENIFDAFIEILKGDNIGKALVKI